MDDLGSRIRQAADTVGGLDRLLPFLGDVKRRTLTDYVSGKSEPRVSTIIAISKATGCRLEWLLTGDGAQLDQAEKIDNSPDILTDLLRRLARMAKGLHEEAGIILREEDIAAEAASLYNDLRVRVDDLSDVDEVETTLPQLEVRLKKRLKAASAAPGTGKRLA
ncbi:helix-turn-helix domain-containing protein [Brucella sp. 21LCYQ03]|nr:helix-turn-helix domain-containing protein [Brucella sp. 21LCYQ03]